MHRSFLPLLAVLLLAATTVALQAADYTWDGTTGTWSDSRKWRLNNTTPNVGVPGVGDKGDGEEVAF